MDIILKRQTIVSVGEDVEELGPSNIVGGNVKQYSHFKKQSGSYSNGDT